MATMTNLAVGKISRGNTEVRVAPRNGDQVLAALSFGRRLFEMGAARTECHNQDEEAGYDEAEQEVRKPRPEGSRGALQRVIDYGAELQEQIDGRLDNEYHASGNW